MLAVQSMVKEVKEKELILQNGDVMPYGLCVWYGFKYLFSGKLHKWLGCLGILH